MFESSSTPPPDDSGDDDPLYQAALAVERDEALASEMAEWEAATIDDGWLTQSDCQRFFNP